MSKSLKRSTKSTKRRALAGVITAAVAAMVLFAVCDDNDLGLPKKCQAGYTWNGTECVPDELTCNPPRVPNTAGTACVCPTGNPNYNSSANTCNPACTGGDVWDGTQCVEASSCAVDTDCAGTLVCESGQCVPGASGLFCDYGQPSLHPGTGEEEGGCHAISGDVTEKYCTDNHGKVVNTCPKYDPPVQGVYCDFGFGNVVVMSRAQCEADEYGVVQGEGGYYCNFGQPDRYGSGGCFFRPGTIQQGGFTATFPWGSFEGRCFGGTFTQAQVDADQVPEDAQADLVDMLTCRGSNQFNPCIPDANNPGDETGVPDTKQCKGPFPLDVSLDFTPQTVPIPTNWLTAARQGESTPAVWCTHPSLGTPDGSDGSNFLHCQWDTGCSNINNGWEPEEAWTKGCAQLVTECLEDGNGLYYGVREPAAWLIPDHPDNDGPNYGTGKDCVADGNFTLVP